MGIVTNLIKQGEKLYTKNGCRLIAKKTNLPLDLSIVDDCIMAEKAVKASIVEVETAFGKGKTTIKSYFDKENKLVRRKINKNIADKSDTADIDYSGDFKTGRTRTMIRNNNGQYTHEFSQMKVSSFSKVLERKTHLMESDPIKGITETQVIEELAPQGKRNFIQTSRMFDSNDIKITGNVASQQELDELLKSPYMSCITYENDRFLNAIKGYAAKQQKVDNLDISVYDVSLKGNTLGQSYGSEKYIEVDVGKHSSKAEIVDTINHEYRHQFQHYVVDKYSHPLLATLSDAIDMKKRTLSQGFFSGLLTDLGIIKNKTKIDTELVKEELKASKKWAKEFKSYIKPEDNYNGYYNQEVEKDARKAGEKAKKEFVELTDRINGYFKKLRLDLLFNEQQKRDYQLWKKELINLQLRYI